MEKTFEELLNDLEQIVNKLKGENTPLEEALALYKKGISLSKLLTTKLNSAKEIIIRDANE
ncbi:MAG: exodeoxyribonuclease VII small subunit [Acholeplasmatales bacterium]|jgi:exodeoxyribonuclease VII small subunit|nr:exodeoxyribonuclease VII small subunit [Acholeplasmatales bacterium]